MTKNNMKAALAGLARSAKACEVCGREMGANNYARHLATHSNGNGAAKQKPGPKRDKQSQSTRAATVAVGRYLDQLAEGGYSGFVSLGALEGFPTHTDDPEVVDAAADSIEARAVEATSRIVELKLRQRVANLRAAADDLRDVANGEDAEAGFIAVGASWAEQNDIEYATFRDMGVPARVLKEAGISR